MAWQSVVRYISTWSVVINLTPFYTSIRKIHCEIEREKKNIVTLSCNNIIDIIAGENRI